jgi:serine/threonine protein kinase
LSGELLSTRLKRTNPQPPSRQFAWSVIRDIGLGVAHAHSRHVVHGDLKPQNIMITRGGEVRILDFGASGSLRPVTSDSAHALQRDLVPAVTPAYTCCELLDGQRADPRDDLFALACLSYELLSGNHPFQGRSSIAARKEMMVPPRPPDLTHRQWRMLQQGLAWRREDRAIDVSVWLANLDVEAAARGPRRLLIPMSARTRHVLLGLGVAASLGALLIYQFSPTNGEVPLDHPVASLVAASLTGPVATSVAASPGDNLVSEPLKTVSTVKRPRRPVKVWAESVKVLPGERFAQITVARSAAEGRSEFTWWTEGSTAMPGSDFVAQNPTTQFFTQGRRSTNLFVRLLPNQARKNSQMFYVALGKPGGDAAMARAAIWIPSEAGKIVASN